MKWVLATHFKALNDEFINDEMRLNEVKFYQNLGFDTHVYDGNHDIDPFVIQQILK